MAAPSATTDHRGSIIDTVVRFVQALDDSDADLLSSTITDTMVMDPTACNEPLGRTYEPFVGRDTVVPRLIKATSMDTMHQVSNFRIHMKDADDKEHGEAVLTCYALAQHMRKGEGLVLGKKDYFLMGNKYEVTLVREASVWKIQQFILKPSWVVGDESVMKID